MNTPDLLASYTEAELQALELARIEAAKVAEAKAQAAERKVRADKMRDIFSLTPNDEPQRNLL